jgi:Protein of unknown function (DUF2752)
LFRRSAVRQRLGTRTRCLLLFAAVGMGGLLGVAKWLEPDPRGFGTHTQLGLQPCAFARVTGRLCPTCGMTTSFAWFMRGRVDRSWRANPAGFLLALLTVPLIAWFVSSAVADEPVGFRSLAGPLLSLLAGAVVLSLAFWLIRLLVSPGGLAGPWTETAAASRSAGM